MITFAPEWTRERITAFVPLVKAPQGDRQATIDAFNAVADPHKEWMAQTVLDGTVGLTVGNAFCVPVLSPAMCADILAWSETRQWAENEHEEPAYRMREIVLAHVDPAYDERVKTILLYALAPYFGCIYGKLPDKWNSVQLTQYSAADRAGGNYHVDSSGKYTAVIALTDAFVGGGTDMYSGAFGSVHVPPLPIGWALIFRGRDTFHRGSPVTAGTRKLLTVWCDDHDQ